MTKPRRMGERRGWAFTFAITVVKPLLLLFTRHHWVDGAKLPAQGGAVVVANHVSHILAKLQARDRVDAVLRRTEERAHPCPKLHPHGELGIALVGDPEHHRELLVVGPEASRTAEVQAVAEAGQVALSDSTAALPSDSGDELPGVISQLICGKRVS